MFVAWNRFKGELRPKLHPCFHVIFLLIVRRKCVVKSFVAIWLDFTKLQSYKVLHSAYVSHTRECIKHVTPGFLCIVYYFYGENSYYNKVLWCFYHFLRTCKVAKSWTIELYLCISDVIHANEQTKYVDCGLHVNFWNFL